MAIWIVLIISLIAAIAITNGAQKLYMRLIGASGIFYSGKKKLIAIVVITLLLASGILYVLGIEIPK